jgi:predicted nuclease of predicted toxin-antitoxin system
MKLLLDECVTRYIKRDLAGHEVHTIEQAGLKGLKNGVLLRAAAGVYHVLVTVDRNMPQQQNLRVLPIAILILEAQSNAYRHLQPLMPRARAALQTIKPGDVVRIKK